MSAKTLKLMRKYKHWIYTSALLLIGVLLCISYHNNDVLETRINTLNSVIYKDVGVDKILADKSFKEDYYIRQQDRDTTLLLWLIPIFFTLFALLSFQGFISKVAEFKKDQKAKYRKHKKDWSSTRHKLLEIKAKIAQENAVKSELLAIEYLQQGFEDKYLDASLSSLEYYFEYYVWFKKKYPELAEDFIKGQAKSISKIYENIKGKDLSAVHSIAVNFHTKQIREINNYEISNYLSLIEGEVLKSQKSED